MDNKIIYINDLLSKRLELNRDDEYVYFLATFFKAGWILHNDFDNYLKYFLNQLVKKYSQKYTEDILKLIERHTTNLSIPRECIFELYEWRNEAFNNIQNAIVRFQRMVIIESKMHINKSNYPHKLQKALQNQKAQLENHIYLLLTNHENSLKHILFKYATVRQVYNRNSIIYMNQNTDTTVNHTPSSANVKLIINNYRSWLIKILYTINNPTSIKRIPDMDLIMINNEINYELEFSSKILKELDSVGAVKILQKFNFMRQRFACQQMLTALKNAGFNTYQIPLKTIRNL